MTYFFTILCGLNAHKPNSMKPKHSPQQS